MVRVHVSLIQRLNRLRNFIINPRVHTPRIYDSANSFFLFYSPDLEGIRGTIGTTCIKRVGTTMTNPVAYRERFSQIEKPPGEFSRGRGQTKRRRIPGWNLGFTEVRGGTRYPVAYDKRGRELYCFLSRARLPSLSFSEWAKRNEPVGSSHGNEEKKGRPTVETEE